MIWYQVSVPKEERVDYLGNSREEAEDIYNRTAGTELYRFYTERGIVKKREKWDPDTWYFCEFELIEGETKWV